MGGSYEIRTVGGYPLDEVSSALQKSIRRGMELDALYWAMELSNGYSKYLWYRLRVIALEEMAPDILQLVDVCYRWFQELVADKRRTGDTHFCVSHVVYALCRAQKSRQIHNYQALMAGLRQEGLRLEIPEFALDKHTKRGRQMGKTMEDFWGEGDRLENKIPEGEPYADEYYERAEKVAKSASQHWKDWSFMGSNGRKKKDSTTHKEPSLF